MADLSFLGRLGALGSGYYQGQDERLRRAQLQQQLLQQQQQQRGMEALANALYLPTPPQGQGGQPPGAPQAGPGAPQMPPGPQPPMPGQPSQPAPGQQPPGPPMGIQAPPRMGPQRGSVGMPPPMGQQQPMQPPPLKPYTAPQAPQQPGPPPGGAPGGMPSIPAPPQVTQAVQSTLPDLKTMAETLKKQGITGLPLFYALQQHSQFLSADGKQQLALLSQQVKELQAMASVQRSNTGAAAETRHEQFDAGASPRGAAVIGRTQAQTDEASARADRLRRSPAIGAGGGRPSKPQVYTGEDGKMYSRVMTPDGQIIVRDSSGRLVQDDQPTPVTPGQSTMRNTVKLDEAEIDYALDNMKKAGPDATASIFFDSPGPGKGGFFESGTLGRWRDNSLTPDEYQEYDVYANRIATAVAGIQSMGRGQVSDEKIRMARKLVPVPGDSDRTITTKLAAIQRIRDQANKIMKGKQPDDIRDEGKPKPTQADRDAAKRLPGGIEQFRAHFGVDP